MTDNQRALVKSIVEGGTTPAIVTYLVPLAKNDEELRNELIKAVVKRLTNGVSNSEAWATALLPLL